MPSRGPFRSKAHALAGTAGAGHGGVVFGGLQWLPIDPVVAGARDTPFGRCAHGAPLLGDRPRRRLEPCGCTKDQLGGLDHFGAWVASRRSHVPVAFVAASGPLFFMDEKLETERADQDRQKAFTLARVLRGLDFLAFAPGANDWADGSETLAKLASEAGAVPIVANADASAAASVVVRDVVGADGGVLKVGFVGYGQPLPGGY